MEKSKRINDILEKSRDIYGQFMTQNPITYMQGNRPIVELLACVVEMLAEIAPPRTPTNK